MLFSGKATKRLGSGYEFLLPVAPTLDRDWFKALIGSGSMHLVGESLPALHHSRAGIIASGTATVEAAMMGTPFVMVYRVSPLTYLLGKPRVKVSHFAMVNLIAGREIVPELVQHDFTADNVIEKLKPVLADGPARGRMIEGFEAVRRSLRGATDSELCPAADRAAEEILTVAGKRGG
jgi:lipid-A-disaccharide synthase